MSSINAPNYGDQISWLEKLINNIQQSVYFNISMMWTMLGVVIAIIGVALYFVAKVWVEKAVEHRLALIKKEFDEEIAAIKKRQMKWASGSISPLGSWTDNILRIVIGGNEDISLRGPNELTVTSAKNAATLEYEAEIIKGEIHLKLLNYDPNSHGMMINWNLKWFDLS